MDYRDDTDRGTMMDARGKMMEQIHKHQQMVYTFGGLVIVGFVILIAFQYLILKQLRK